MPYCPKCDMEYIDGITICNDCKGPLVPSKEMITPSGPPVRSSGTTVSAAIPQENAGPSDNDSPDRSDDESGIVTYGRTYIKKADQYQDLRSSFLAFLVVGGLLLAAAVLSLTGILRLPFASSSKIVYEVVMIILSLGAFAVAVQSLTSARRIQSHIQEEESVTSQLIEWFLNHHDAKTIDYQLTMEGGFEDLAPEEQDLKRYELIQDIFLITHDISDESYVEHLAEEIYTKIYQ